MRTSLQDILVLSSHPSRRNRRAEAAEGRGRIASMVRGRQFGFSGMDELQIRYELGEQKGCGWEPNIGLATRTVP